MVQPNSLAAGFCFWMLNISKQQLSGPQKIIVQNVYNSALGNYPISDQEWFNFNLFTAWRNPYYLVFRDYAALESPDLGTNLIAAFSFDGSSMDSTGNFVPTDSNMLYSIPAGKINQGAIFNGINSSIFVPGLPFSTNFSLGFWINPDIASAGAGSLINTASGSNGLFFDASSDTIQLFLGGVSVVSSAIPRNAYTCVMITASLSQVKLYLNGVLDKTVNAVMPSAVLPWVGTNGSSIFFKGFLDILTFWSKPLSQQNATDFFNAASGIQYPF